MVIPVLFLWPLGGFPSEPAGALPSAEAIIAVSPDSKEDALALFELLKSSDSDTQQTAAYALGGMGKSVLPDLVEMLKDADPAVRRGAAKGLGQIAYHARKEYTDQHLDRGDPFSNSFAEKSAQVDLKAQEVSRDLCQEATPALVQALNDQDNSVRIYSASALVLIGSEVERTVPILTAGLADLDLEMRGVAALNLAWCGPKAKPAFPSLIRILNEEQNTELRKIAMGIFGNLRAEGKDAVPALIEALKDRDTEIQISAVTALGYIGPEAKKAVPELLRLLKGKDTSLQISAVRALGDIGSGTEEVIPALERLNKDTSNALLSDFCDKALRKIRGVDKQRSDE